MDEQIQVVEVFYDDTNVITGITEQTEAIEILTENVLQLIELERAQYISNLFVIGTICAVGVCLLLYKFIKLFI